MTFHTKTPYRCGIVASYAFFLGVETDALADVVVAGRAPDVVGHFEADNEDALVEFVGTTAEGMGASHFVDVGLSIVVRRVVLVERLHPCKLPVYEPKVVDDVGDIENTQELNITAEMTLTLNDFL
jgi:hypothetical protein